ncbi:protein 2a [Babaco ilarvirus 1]|nr:protein 2a [Babaco ilarvirus 1]
MAMKSATKVLFESPSRFERIPEDDESQVYHKRMQDDIRNYNILAGLRLVVFLRPELHFIFNQFLDTEFAPYVRERFLSKFVVDEPELIIPDYELEPLVCEMSEYDEYEAFLASLSPEEYEQCFGTRTNHVVDAVDVVDAPIEVTTEDSSHVESVDDSISDLGSEEKHNDLPTEVILIEPVTEDIEDINVLDDFRPPLTVVSKCEVGVLPMVPVFEPFESNQLLLVREVCVDKLAGLMEMHERIIARNDWRSLAMYLPVADIPTTSDILSFPVKHTQPEFIQMAIDELLPGISDLDDRFFQELVETSDISLELDSAKIDLSVHNDWVKPRKLLSSVINTGHMSKRIPTFREAALAIKKRNLNVPDLQQVMFEDEEARKIANRFINTVIDPNKLSQFPGFISEGEIGYFNKYLTGKNVPAEMFVDPCALVSMDKYRHMIKTQLKPVEDVSQLFERALPATITYHDKGKVMSSSPIFLMLCNRLLLCLREKISIPSGQYHQLFSLDPFAFEMSKEFKEIDFSKFDKSQQRLHHLIQYHIFNALGAPKEFLEMWFGSHEISHIRDGPCGIGFNVNYQRRTGDACTYLGNTIITLSALAYMYDLLDPNILFVIASGDDSLIGSVEPLSRDTEFQFTTLFNFEAKFPHNMPFICSKFLVLVPTESGGKKVVAVPNPLKLNIKLGTKELSPYTFDSWYESWLDTIWYFSNYHIISVMRDYVSHRYARKQTMFQEGAMLAYGTIFASKEKCLKTLFGITRKELDKMIEPEKKGKSRWCDTSSDSSYGVDLDDMRKATKFHEKQNVLNGFDKSEQMLDQKPEKGQRSKNKFRVPKKDRNDKKRDAGASRVR